MKINIDYTKCDKCGTCISVCCSDALILTDELECCNKKCSLCNQCVKICPFGALKVS
ncbi:4Fe-4S binding protein [Cellulosispirillum alkaliphilum]|uniref:4Fe-4S binding protein n=1 Tax=Cellulosispirillum alkaliphilum TaxID=3039283 RepID=UPI003D6F46DF